MTNGFGSSRGLQQYFQQQEEVLHEIDLRKEQDIDQQIQQAEQMRPQDRASTFLNNRFNGERTMHNNDAWEENEAMPTTESVANDSQESKSDAFKRLAEPRVTSILDKLRILGNLSDKNRYEYSQDQVDRMETAVKEQVHKTFTKFREQKSEGFTFD